MHATFFFFFFLKKKLVQDMLTSGHDKMRISIVILNFGHASHRFDGFEVLDVLPRGPMVWNLGRASQRSKESNFGHAS